MQILTPEAAKKGSTAAEDELRARVRDLSTEEERLVSSVNGLRAEEASEKERITAERDRISAEIAEKESDVIKLEERRAEAMKPVDALEQIAQERVDAANSRHVDLDRREELLVRAENGIIADLEDVHDKVQELDEREDGLDAREDMVKSFEEQTAASAKSLGDKWVEYHATVAAKNAELLTRENAVSTAEATNETARMENIKEAARLRDENRAVRDKYVALEQAKTHLGIQ